MSGRYGRERLGVRGKVLRAGLFLTALGATACEIPPTPGGQPTPPNSPSPDRLTSTDTGSEPTETSSIATPTETATPTVEPWTPTSTEYPTETQTSTQEPTATEVDRMAEIAVEADAFFKSEGKYTDEAMHDWVQQGLSGDRELGVVDEFSVMSYFQGLLLGHIEDGVSSYLYFATKDKQGKRVIIVANAYTDNLGGMGKAQLFPVTTTQSNAIPQRVDLDNSFFLESMEELKNVEDERTGKVMTINVFTALFERLPADQASFFDNIKVAMGVDGFNVWHDRIEAQKETALELTNYLFRATTDTPQNVPEHDGYAGIIFTSSDQLRFDVENFSGDSMPMVTGIMYRVK